MFVVLMHYKKPIEIVDQYLVSHRNYLSEGYQKNYFIASGPQNPRTGGVILSNVKKREDLVEILNQDPFILNDIAHYEIIEFDPVKYHPNFTSFII